MSVSKFEKMISSIQTWDLYNYMSYKQKRWAKAHKGRDFLRGWLGIGEETTQGHHDWLNIS